MNQVENYDNDVKYMDKEIKDIKIKLKTLKKSNRGLKSRESFTLMIPLLQYHYLGVCTVNIGHRIIYNAFPLLI